MRAHPLERQPNGSREGRVADSVPPKASPRSARGPALGPDSERALRPGRGGSPRSLAESLPGTLERLGLSAGLEDARVFGEWENAVGVKIARVARPHRLDGGTLIVHVKSSAWMAELSLRRSEILDRVNAGRARRPIRQIVFRIDTALEG